MSAILRRRIEKIEGAVMPKPVQRVVILLDPGVEASADDRAAFNQDIDFAIDNGQLVVIVSGKNANTQLERGGVEFVESETEAQLIVLARQPSEQGRADKLADVMAGLSGNVMGVSNCKDKYDE